MATPAMLRPREPRRQPFSSGLDGVAAVSVLLLGTCSIGLFVAGILAVYDYSTPSSVAPLVLVISVMFGAVMALNVVAATVRHFSRR